jgi:hypothetical protein
MIWIRPSAAKADLGIRVTRVGDANENAKSNAIEPPRRQERQED